MNKAQKEKGQVYRGAHMENVKHETRHGVVNHATEGLEYEQLGLLQILGGPSRVFCLFVSGK